MFYIEINEKDLQELRKDVWKNVSRYSEYMQLFKIYEFRLLSDFGYTWQWKLPLFSMTVHMITYNIHHTKLC